MKALDLVRGHYEGSQAPIVLPLDVILRGDTSLGLGHGSRPELDASAENEKLRSRNAEKSFGIQRVLL